MHDSGYVCGSVCERVCVRVRVHVCTQRFVSENFLLRGSAPRLKSSPLVTAFPSDIGCCHGNSGLCGCFVLVVVYFCLFVFKFCSLLFRYVSSYGEQDDQTWRNTCRSGYT